MSTETPFRCPTCGAKQPRQPDCRRCGADLSLLLQVLAAHEKARRKCLTALRAGRFEEAMRAARIAQRILPDQDLAEKLAFAASFSGDRPRPQSDQA